MKRVPSLSGILLITVLLLITGIATACASTASPQPTPPVVSPKQPPSAEQSSNPTAPPAPAQKTPATIVSQDSNVKSIKVGDTAPDFELKDVDGNYFKLSSLRGKKVLVNMWWLSCKGCTGEVQYFQEVHEKWLEKGLVVVAISVYDRDDIIRSYAQNNKLSYTMLVDPDKTLNRSYIICGVPTTFFIDEEGVVRAIQNSAFNNAEEIDNMLNSF